MVIIKMILIFIEKINFKYNFLKFELKGWSDEAYKTVEKEKHIIAEYMTEKYDNVKEKIYGK